MTVVPFVNRYVVVHTPINNTANKKSYNSRYQLLIIWCTNIIDYITYCKSSKSKELL